MNLIFNNNGEFILAQKKVNSFYQNNEDFTVCFVEDYDLEYTYSYINNSVVKGNKFVVSEEELKVIEEENKSRKYKEPRILNYPSLGEQLDKLFHDIDNGTLNKNGAFYNAIKEVKDLYPKN